MPYTTPSTWVAGNVLTAAQLNQQIRDNLNAIFPLGAPDAAWTAYTPTLVQTGAVSKTVTYARYTKIGRTVIAQLFLAVTGTGTAGATVQIGLPVAATATAVNLDSGTGDIYDTSTGQHFYGNVTLVSTTAVSIRMASGGNGFLGGGTFTAALAAGDEVRVNVVYEAAA